MKDFFKLEFSLINFILLLAWSLGFIIFFQMFYLYIEATDLDNKLKVLPAVTILISSFIASFSVMKSIKNVNDNNVLEKEKVKKKNILQFCFYIKGIEESLKNSSLRDIKHIKSLILGALKDKDIISSIDGSLLLILNDQLSSVSQTYSIEKNLKEKQNININNKDANENIEKLPIELREVIRKNFPEINLNQSLAQFLQERQDTQWNEYINIKDQVISANKRIQNILINKYQEKYQEIKDIFEIK